jgi:hypothetical protein
MVQTADRTDTMECNMQLDGPTQEINTNWMRRKTIW